MSIWTVFQKKNPADIRYYISGAIEAAAFIRSIFVLNGLVDVNAID